MTEIATIRWFGRWGTSVFTENTAIFFLSFSQNFLPWENELFIKTKRLILNSFIYHMTSRLRV